MSFADTPVGKVPFNSHFIGLWFLLKETLRGKDMFDFGCADAERQRAEGSMRGGVTITTDNGHARLRSSKFRTNDMNDAAVWTIHAVERDPEFGGIGFHLPDLRRSHCIRDGDIKGSRRNRMIHRRERLIGAADFESTLTKTCECLRRSHFMDEMQINIKNGGTFGRLFGDNVQVPDLLE